MGRDKMYVVDEPVQEEMDRLNEEVTTAAHAFDELLNKVESLEGIIVRFKAGCKITGKGPVDKNCEMVEQLQAELAKAREENKQRCIAINIAIHLICSDDDFGGDNQIRGIKILEQAMKGD